MATLFLIMIYLAFISLGLPDSLLGSSWPVLQLELGAPLDLAGYVAMVVSGGTIISSLASDSLLRRFGTGLVASVSVLMTAVALLGYSISPSAIWFFVFAIPLGLGAGSVDAGLNAYVAAHYKAYHMSWLHCFWGLGASAGPIIMSLFLQNGKSWRNGYSLVAFIQLGLSALLFLALPLWMKFEKSESGNKEESESQGLDKEGEGNNESYNGKPLNIKGVKSAMIAFLFYCGLEMTVGLWGSSYLVNVRKIDVVTAARWVSLYYAGITVGRLINGFIAIKFTSRTLIRGGQLLILAGTLLLLLPLPAVSAMVGFILIGLGCAPIYPCMIHETPNRFGRKNAQKIIGLQMACAYTGSTFLPPLLGWIASRTYLGIMPYFLMIYIAGMLFCSERINRMLVKNNSNAAA